MIADPFDAAEAAYDEARRVAVQALNSGGTVIDYDIAMKRAEAVYRAAIESETNERHDQQ